MTSSDILKVREILDNEGWEYETDGNDLLLMAAYGTRKWRMVISCEDKGRVCCYSVFPWPAAEDKATAVTRALNEQNLAQRRGCFMLNSSDMKVVFRCSAQLLDEYTSYDYIKDLLLYSVAAVNANWEEVYGMIFSKV